MNRRPVACDFCGEPIVGLTDGWVQWRRDALGVVTALTLVHQIDRCMYDAETETAVGAVEDHHAEAFLDERHVAYLRNLPRYLEGTSVSRVIAKVRALARLDHCMKPCPVCPTPEPTAPAPDHAPSVRESEALS
jgi:hypothetical protein